MNKMICPICGIGHMILYEGHAYFHLQCSKCTHAQHSCKIDRKEDLTDPTAVLPLGDSTRIVPQPGRALGRARVGSTLLFGTPGAS